MRSVLQSVWASLLALALCGLSGSARADTDEPEVRARAYFDAGRAHYRLGDYPEAAKSFAAGYKLLPRPEFILNLAQCYRKLGDLPRAERFLEQYLRELPPDHPTRADAMALL